MRDAIAVLNDVSYLYPGATVPAIRDLSLTVERGEFLGLIGANGAGKTTLCLALNGIVPQFYGGRFFGAATVAGLDTLDHPISTLATHVGVVLEDPDIQITATSVENEIAFGLENLRVPREEIRRRIPEVLAMVRLDGLAHKHPQELSGGQKQRLAIAAVLAMQPKLMVLDEPTSQLDPVGAQEVFEALHTLNHDLGITIIIASHAAEELAEHANRLVLLDQGQIVTQSAPATLYSQTALMTAHNVRPPQVSRTFDLLREAGCPGMESEPMPPVTLRDGIQALQPIVQQCNLPAAWSDTSVPSSTHSQSGSSPPLSRGIDKLESLERAGTPSAAAAHPRTRRTSTPLITVRDLGHTYPDGTQALYEVSLDIHAGEYMLITGQNGAGKSTLVRHFVRLLLPTVGRVEVDGIPTRDLTTSTLARRIGYVAQNPDQQIFNTTVADEVAFALRQLEMAPAEVQRRTEESLAEMSLSDERDRHPLSLPKGDRARVVVAAVLALAPEMIIFDEPTTGQDLSGATAILEITRQLHAQGRTVVVITHHLALAAPYVERVVVMGKGTILLDGPTDRVFQTHEVLTETYLAPPQAVLLAQAWTQATGRPLAALTPEQVAAGILDQCGRGNSCAP